jgi:hypothetical protein
MGPRLLQFTFKQKDTDFGHMLETCFQTFVDSARASDLPVSQLHFIVSDGKCF